MLSLSQAISFLEDNLDIRIKCIEKYYSHLPAYQKNAADTLPVICILKFSLTDNTASTLSLQMQPDKLSNTLKELRSLALFAEKDGVRNVTEALLCILFCFYSQIWILNNFSLLAGVIRKNIYGTILS